jgi:hypothetical protein
LYLGIRQERKTTIVIIIIIIIIIIITTTTTAAAFDGLPVGQEAIRSVELDGMHPIDVEAERPVASLGHQE